MHQRRTIFSVEDKKILREYQVLKKQLHDTPEWDEHFKSYQGEVDQFLKNMSGDLLQAGEEKKKIDAMLREIRKEKRIVNRIVEEEKTRRKEKTIFPTIKKTY